MIRETDSCVIDGRPETLLATLDESLARLRTEYIDLYYLHRVDPEVPIEDSVGAMSRMVEAGKVGSLGLSEVSAHTLKRAHGVHPIAAVQTEYSLWTRNAEIAVLDACRETGAAFVAFSPLGRGFLADPDLDPLRFGEKDIRRPMPRFSPGHFASNRALATAFGALAGEAGCTMAQLALAWLLNKDDVVLPIPGTTSIAHLKEDVAAMTLDVPAELLVRAGELINHQTVHGARYPAAVQNDIDTETFPDESSGVRAQA